MLPRVPADLPILILKDPKEKNDDRAFRVRKQKVVDALVYLKANNEDYQDIIISQENADLFPDDDILQHLPQLNPKELHIPNSEPTAANDESAREHGLSLT